MDETPPFIGFLPPHMRRTPSPKRMPGAHAQHQWTLGAHQTPSPNRPVRATPSPKRMPRAHAHQWTLGAHQTPSPNRPVRATPSPKRMPGAHAQHQWTLGAHQTPSPKRPVRAPPSPTDRYEQPLPPKGCRGRNISGRWGRIRPLSPTDRYEQPLPPTSTSLYKGVTDRAHC